MKLKLLLQAGIKFIVGLLLVSSILFLSAGTFNYPNAWLLIILLFVPMFFVGFILGVTNPQLLEKRLRNKEKETVQKKVILITAIIFILGFIIAGIDFRYTWSKVPNFIIGIGSIVLVIAYTLYIEVIRENQYLSRTIEIQEEQKVIDTGLYKIVRHPMYLSTTLLFISFPIVLRINIFIYYIFIYTVFACKTNKK